MGRVIRKVPHTVVTAPQRARREPEPPTEEPDPPTEAPKPKGPYTPPTTEDGKRLKIQELAGLSIPIRNIAAKAGCTEEDLRAGGKYYDDVCMGDADANIDVAMAVKKRAAAGVPAMASLWMRCRAGWNEVGSKETIEGKKVRGFEKMTWEVIEGGGESVAKEKRRSATAKRPVSATQVTSVVDPGAGEPRRIIPPLDPTDTETSDPQVDGSVPEPSAVQGGARGAWGREVARLRADAGSSPRSGPGPEHGVYPGSPEVPAAVSQEAGGTVDPKARSRRPL